MKMVKSCRKCFKIPLGCSLVIALKDVKTGLYGKDGYAVETPESKGITEKVTQGQSQEREDSDSG